MGMGAAADEHLGGGTLAGRYEARVAAYRDLPERRKRALQKRTALETGKGPRRDAKRKELDREERLIAQAEHEEIEFLLDAMPFIREYCAPTPPSAPHSEQPPPSTAKPAPTGRLDEFWDVSQKSNHHNVLQRYLLHVEKKVDATTVAAEQQEHNAGCNPRDAEYVCASCDGPTVVHAREALLVCPRCGACRPSMDMQTTYEQEVHQDVSTYFSYKRQNHFCEWLNTIQAKENTEIPVHVIDAVRAEFKKVRASRRADITPVKVKAFLKKLRFNQYYEHANSICNNLNGVPPPKLSAQLEALLKAMFAEIQEPWRRNKPKNRKNFLSYSFTLYKFCELLGEDWMLKHFPLLKSGDKLYKQDHTWRLICRDLLWEYIPSI